MKEKPKHRDVYVCMSECSKSKSITGGVCKMKREAGRENEERKEQEEEDRKASGMSIPQYLAWSERKQKTNIIGGHGGVGRYQFFICSFLYYLFGELLFFLWGDQNSLQFSFIKITF